MAAFGNSKLDQPSEWVPLTYKNFPSNFVTKGNPKPLLSKGCDIISSLHITIAYAFVGSIDFPQAKITGVLYELGDSVSYSQNKVSKELGVSTTVTFKDLTSPPVLLVPKWPVLSIRLPKDFFYPFSSG